MAELIAGGLIDILELLVSAAFSAMLLSEKAALTEAEWSIIVTDFENGIKFIKAALVVKFDFIRRLPWKFGGLAHRLEGAVLPFWPSFQIGTYALW